MKRIALSFAVAAGFAAALALTACDGDLTPSTGPTNCSTNADCDTTEICHPVGKVCIKTCESVSDCPSPNDLCNDLYDIDFTTLLGKVCRCTENSCTGGQKCNSVDDLCEDTCSTNADCSSFNPARVCDPQDSLCEFGAAPECSDNQGCTSPEKSKCDTSAGVCVGCSIDFDCNHIDQGLKCNAGLCESQGTTCNAATLAPGANGGPDTCAYGEVCDANTCNANLLPDGTCAPNHNYTWVEAQQGPVIFVANAQSFASHDDCAGKGGGFHVDIEFYAPNGVASASGWSEKVQQIKFYLPTSTTPVSAGIFSGTWPAANATYGSFTTGMCGTGGAQVDPTGYAVYMLDSQQASGNLVCL